MICSTAKKCALAHTTLTSTCVDPPAFIQKHKDSLKKADSYKQAASRSWSRTTWSPANTPTLSLIAFSNNTNSLPQTEESMERHDKVRKRESAFEAGPTNSECLLWERYTFQDCLNWLTTSETLSKFLLVLNLTVIHR